MANMRMPAMTRGRIKAVRALMLALRAPAASAEKARELAENRHGPLSSEYAEANARYGEAHELTLRLHKLLQMRLDELEGPFRRG